MLIPAALVLATILSGPDDTPSLQRFAYREPHMGTEFTLLLYSTDEPTARLASRSAFERVEALNASLSDYDPHSELMRLCSHAGEGPVRVSDDLFRVLKLAIDVAERSGGAFDPTVGPVGRLWRRARRNHRIPEPDTLAKARELVDYHNVRLNEKDQTVQLLKKGIKLDLGGIAKGFAADEALKVLRKHGISHALVAAAGDIAAGDPPPGRDGWVVAVAPLKAAGEDPSPALKLANRAVSTSGDAEQFVEIGGVRYSHIVDPRTGLGVQGRSSATVTAPDATTTDALATAVSVLGPELGMKLVEQTPGASAFYVRVKEDQTLEVVKSRRWDRVPQVKEAGETDHGPAREP
jgi:thiamine biosynthesis lipoprotein